MTTQKNFITNYTTSNPINDSTNKYKYIKYKSKYLTLKQNSFMSGGHKLLNINDPVLKDKASVISQHYTHNVEYYCKYKKDLSNSNKRYLYTMFKCIKCPNFGGIDVDLGGFYGSYAECK